MRAGGVAITGHAGLPRTADVIADTDAVVYLASETLTRETVADAPDPAAALHRSVAITLAERPDRTNKLLGDQS